MLPEYLRDTSGWGAWAGYIDKPDDRSEDLRRGYLDWDVEVDGKPLEKILVGLGRRTGWAVQISYQRKS